MVTEILADKRIKNNLIIFSAFIFIAIIGSIYGYTIRDNHEFLRVWDYQNILMLFLAVPFLFLQSKAKLPNFWEANISVKKKLLFPALIGSIFGILDIFVMKIIQHPEPYTELPPFLQPFPYSCFLYFSGALEVEIFYRLIPLTLILLLGNWYRNGKYYYTFFIIGAILTSLREPIEQLPDGSISLIMYSLVTGFLMNYLQANFYIRSGFLASIAVRLGHYLFWHILLGIYVQYVEL